MPVSITATLTPEPWFEPQTAGALTFLTPHGASSPLRVTGGSGARCARCRPSALSAEPALGKAVCWKETGSDSIHLRQMSFSTADTLELTFRPSVAMLARP